MKEVVIPEQPKEDPYNLSVVIDALTEFIEESSKAQAEYKLYSVDDPKREELSEIYEGRKASLLKDIQSELDKLTTIKTLETQRRSPSDMHHYHLSLCEGLENLMVSLRRSNQENELTPDLLKLSLQQLQNLKNYSTSSPETTGSLTKVSPALIKIVATTAAKVGGVVTAAWGARLGIQNIMGTEFGPEQVNSSPPVLPVIGILVALYLANAMKKRGNTDTALIDTLGKLNTYALKVTAVINDSNLPETEKKDKIELLAHYISNFVFNLHRETQPESPDPLNFGILARSLSKIEEDIISKLSKEMGEVTRIDLQSARTSVNEAREAFASLSKVRMPEDIKTIISFSVMGTIGIITAYQGPATIPTLTTFIILLLYRLGNEIDKSILADSLTALPVRLRASMAILRINKIVQYIQTKSVGTHPSP